jgi:hypothetical protein
MLTKSCFNVNYYLKDRNLSSTGQQSDQLLKDSILQKLMRFGRKILRKIYGPTKLIDGTWRMKTNDKLDNKTEQKKYNSFH